MVVETTQELLHLALVVIKLGIYPPALFDTIGK